MARKKRTLTSEPHGKTNFSFPPSIRSLQSQKMEFYKAHFESVVPAQLFTISNFWSAKQCQDLICSIQESLDLETTPVIKSKLYASRVNDRACIRDPVNAGLIYDYFQKILKFKIGQGPVEEWIVQEMESSEAFNPDLRFYRYSKGQYFGKHYDESVEVGNLKSKWTVLVYLSDKGLKGGETIFYNEQGDRSKRQISIKPQQGMALFHKHGDDCLLHEAATVLDGEKWVFRTDVMYNIYK
ncbi:hypothetical protein KL935_000838 [Ogataea polymorpha]|uniref:Fe2OG dioxygenase domain-containing protein n=1 Tax=Ogataea polymorpha TaxID=460523 RepID=A0A9P8T856_9ASCO|nr:hypothetical protein KL935_000838 [Ogataea polymorpha]KAG7912088.1 hypothetical protein KL906_000292 [Ogataea polymorpha]KAG7920148.1 hypothetical protein KL927_000828 [Ogataea polymorpha]KAH3669903.1 hypothetical protein OGATHE_002715 [Ogataea polymorpha]